MVLTSSRRTTQCTVLPTTVRAGPESEERRRSLGIGHDGGQACGEHRYAEHVGNQLLGVYRPVAEEDVEGELGPDLGDVLKVLLDVRDEELL
jgi:hypothetical protein